ncbi:Eukaryotic peptide chain release factor GTP-binding subunit [Coemansia aciculifera]|nr:Eukaryotic peptide chain release factor GTP-binding subunit [Coemansia aciculifera]
MPTNAGGPTSPTQAQQQPHRQTIVRLSPPQSPNRRTSRTSGDAHDDEGRVYTPRTLVESAAKRATNNQPPLAQTRGHPREHTKYQTPAQAHESGQEHSYKRAQATLTPLSTPEQGRDSSDGGQRHYKPLSSFPPPLPPVLAPPPASHNSIQFLGPQRQTVLRMTMDDSAPTSPHTRNSSSDGTATNSQDTPEHSQPLQSRRLPPQRPQPIGVYEPVEEKVLSRHPERYTSDGLRRKEPIYRLYDHDNCHPLCGRTVTGGRPAPFAMALVMMTTPIVLFAIFVCPYLWNDLHKAAVIVFIYLAALSYASMLMASFTDPGIIPRNLDAITLPDAFAVDVNPNAQDQQHSNSRPQSLPPVSPGAITEPGGKKRRGSEPHESQTQRPPMQYYDRLPPPWIHVGAPGRHSGPLSVYDPVAPPGSVQRPVSDSYRMYPPTTKLVTINNVSVRLKYCDTCRIYRPPRASHCRSCDNCVENEDHHCIWLNNCIGRRNYRYFYSFLFTISVLALYIIAFCLVRLIRPINQHYDGGGEVPTTFGQSVKHHPMALVLLLYVFAHTGMVGGLFVYHTILISRNMTTHELLGARHAQQNDPDAGSASRQFRSPFFFSATSPYSKGSCLSNWAVALCSPMVPTNVQWRARVDPEGIEELVPLHR